MITIGRIALLLCISFLCENTMGTHVDSIAAVCSSPADVLDAFNRSVVCRVSHCLYGTTTHGDSNPGYLSNVGFDHAWISGYHTIERILTVNADNPSGTKKAVLREIGFPESMLNLTQYKYHIFDGCNEKFSSSIRIPTAAEWELLLMNIYGIAVPIKVLIQLVEAGTNFSQITGCDTECVDKYDLLSHSCSCSQEFLNAFKSFSHQNPYNGGNTAECFGLLAEGNITAPVLRAALWQCQDVNALNAFNGLGYDGKSFTLPEFIVNNFAFKALHNLDVSVGSLNLN
eukprot:CFRG1417T1